MTTNPASPKLLPCPFCGDDKQERKIPYGHNGWSCIQCDNCGAVGPYGEIEWNTRAQSAPIEAILELLKPLVEAWKETYQGEWIHIPRHIVEGNAMVAVVDGPIIVEDLINDEHAAFIATAGNTAQKIKELMEGM